MMDVTEAIINRIRKMPNPPCHVGEVVPQGLSRFPYVWLMKSGEEYSDDLCYPRHKDMINYDIEIISDDIDEVRQLTADIKDWLMDTAMHSLEFVNDYGNKQTIHGIIVEDHDDSYISKVPDSDEKIFIAAIDVEAILGQEI